MRDFFDIAPEENFKQLSHKFTEEIDRGHGRVEHRRHWSAENMATARHIMLRQEKTCKKGMKS